MDNYDKQKGIVVILDALGAASYRETEITQFMQSRSIVLKLLEEKIEGTFIDTGRVSFFTFNDTILIMLTCNDEEPNLTDIADIFVVLRKFLVDSMKHKILFRGAVSIGDFYVNDKTNTIMGPAVTDAAAWYDKADWVGIHATPRTSMIISGRLEDNKKRDLTNLMFDYDIPLKDGSKVKLKAINWPKVFFISTITPCLNDEKPKACLLKLLTYHQVPKGTEIKYFNTIAFFDASVESKKVS